MRLRSDRTPTRLVLIAAAGASALLLMACGGTGVTSTGATTGASASGHTIQSTSVTRKSKTAAKAARRGQGSIATVNASPSQLCDVLTEAKASELLGVKEVVRWRPLPGNRVPSCGYEVGPNASTSSVRPVFYLRIFSQEPTRYFRGIKETYEKGATKSPSEVEVKTLSGIGSSAFVLIFRGGAIGTELCFLLDGRLLELNVGGAVPSLTKLEADAEAIAAAG